MSLIFSLVWTQTQIKMSILQVSTLYRVFNLPTTLKDHLHQSKFGCLVSQTENVHFKNKQILLVNMNLSFCFFFGANCLSDLVQFLPTIWFLFCFCAVCWKNPEKSNKFLVFLYFFCSSPLQLSSGEMWMWQIKAFKIFPIMIVQSKHDFFNFVFNDVFQSFQCVVNMFETILHSLQFLSLFYFYALFFCTCFFVKTCFVNQNSPNVYPSAEMKERNNYAVLTGKKNKIEHLENFEKMSVIPFSPPFLVSW